MTHPVSGLSSHLLTKKGLAAKRQWYCQIGPKRRARAETADWRTKASLATRCDNARLQNPGDSEGITSR